MEILWLLQQWSPEIDSVVATLFYGITWFVVLIPVGWQRSIKDVSGWDFFRKKERACASSFALGAAFEKEQLSLLMWGVFFPLPPRFHYSESRA